jgi:hypothetical protein
MGAVTMNRPSRLHGSAPLTVAVPCRGEHHHLRYEAGQLHAPDHDDIDGELALAALGGERPACAELVSAWQSSVDDLRVLTLARRSPSDRLERPPVEVLFPASTPATRGHFARRMAVPAVAPPTAGWFAYAPLASSAPGTHPARLHTSGFRPSFAGTEPDADPLVRLLAFSGGLTQRLVATVIGAWTQRLAAGTAPEPAMPALTAALAGRVGAALAEWTGRPFSDFRVTMGPPEEPPALSVGDEFGVTLPFAWLADVWLPGLAQLSGHFTLGASEDGDALRLNTIDDALNPHEVLLQIR